MSKSTKIVVFSSLFLISSIIHAKDLEASTIEVAGNIGLSIASLETSSSGFPDSNTDKQAASFSGISYFQKNIGVGLSFDYDHTETETAGLTNEITSNMIGPIILFNISTGEKTSVKLHGAAIYSWAEQVDSTFGNTVMDGFGWRIGGQLSYFINDRVSLNTGLSYASIELKDDVFDETFNTKGLAIGAGLSIYLGN